MIPAEFQGCLAAQRNAYLADPYPSRAQRVTDLQSLARLLKGNQAAISAAGNRAMVNMWEHSDHLAKLLISLSQKYFPSDKLMFGEDGVGRGPAFSELPFDHQMFTGSG